MLKVFKELTKISFSGKALIYKLMWLCVVIVHISLNGLTGRHQDTMLMDMFYWPEGITFHSLLMVALLMGMVHIYMYDRRRMLVYMERKYGNHREE